MLARLGAVFGLFPVFGLFLDFGLFGLFSRYMLSVGSLVARRAIS